MITRLQGRLEDLITSDLNAGAVAYALSPVFYLYLQDTDRYQIYKQSEMP